MALQLDNDSFLSGANAPFIAELYERYLDNPILVDESWRAYFDSMQDEVAAIRAEVDGPSWAQSRTQILGQDPNQEAGDGDGKERPAAAVDAATVRAATLDSLRPERWRQ